MYLATLGELRLILHSSKASAPTRVAIYSDFQLISFRRFFLIRRAAFSPTGNQAPISITFTSIQARLFSSDARTWFKSDDTRGFLRISQWTDA